MLRRTLALVLAMLFWGACGAQGSAASTAPAPAHRPAVPPADRAVAQAVVRAYSLESAYWQDPSAFATREALREHYRQGFSAELAERMTEFTLDNDGDMATWVPREVQVVEHDGDSALAWFPVPAAFVHGPWGFAPYMVVRLRREGERWVIYWGTDSATPPSR